MQKFLPPLNWIRAFECAARHLSFTAAAGELNLTQSAVSQHVRSLETRFGTALFVRKARGISLTDAGRRLLPLVSRAIGDLASAAAQFEPVRADNSLKVACSTSFSLLWLAPRLGVFLADHPGTSIQIVSTLWPDDHVLSDIEIRFGSQELVGQGATLLLADMLVPVCAPELLEGVEPWSDPYQAAVIQTVGTLNTWQSWAEGLGLPPPPPMSRSVDSYCLALEFARAGLGTALVSRLLAHNFLAAGDLVVPVDLAAPAKDNYFITVHQTGPDKLSRDFATWLHAQVAPGSSQLAVHKPAIEV